MTSAIDYKKLVESVGDAVMACDAMGKSLDLIIPQRQQQRHWEGYHKTMQTGVTRYGNNVLRVPALHKDGHTLSIAFSVSMLYAPDGKVSHIVAVVRDESARFTEDRNLRKRLAELETQLATQGKTT
jgi:PAS domain S-box-containing protein